MLKTWELASCTSATSPLHCSASCCTLSSNTGRPCKPLIHTLQDALQLYFSALVLQLLILVPYMIKASQHHQTAKDVILRLLDTVTYAAPPGLPALMLLIGLVARSRLKRQGVLLMFPHIISAGAAVDVVCFDKTGTLTCSTVSGALKLPCVRKRHAACQFYSMQGCFLVWT